MRVAVLSDVHGNALALDAVLADIATQGVDATLCLGDHVSGPMDPAGVAERLAVLDGPVISGMIAGWRRRVPKRWVWSMALPPAA